MAKIWDENLKKYRDENGKFTKYGNMEKMASESLFDDFNKEISLISVQKEDVGFIEPNPEYHAAIKVLNIFLREQGFSLRKFGSGYFLLPESFIYNGKNEDLLNINKDDLDDIDKEDFKFTEILDTLFINLSLFEKTTLSIFTHNNESYIIDVDLIRKELTKLEQRKDTLEFNDFIENKKINSNSWYQIVYNDLVTRKRG